MIESKNKVENLMNLVMQLRKVCNHPELFERRPANSPFMFQEIYYYTGFTPIKNGDIKLLPYNSKNPIEFFVPKLVYDEMIYFEEPIEKRNKRLLNIFTPNNMANSSGFSCLRMTNISYGEIEQCLLEDQLFTFILLMHWFKRNPYTSNFSTK